MNATKAALRAGAAALAAAVLFTSAACSLGGTKLQTTPLEDEFESQAAAAIQILNVDRDLAALNQDTACGTLCEILKKGEESAGISLRVRGTFDCSYYSPTANEYLYVNVPNAAGDRVAHLEFVMADGGYVYPDDYPEVGTPIEVCGTLESYDENGVKYLHLVTDLLQVVNNAASGSGATTGAAVSQNVEG